MAASAAQLLDELMGRNRNLLPDESRPDSSWSDPEVCRYFLCGFCPHELFTNTRADLGPCTKIHDIDLRDQYQKSSKFEKLGYEEDFVRYLQSIIADVERRIQRGYDRLKLNNSQSNLGNANPTKKEEKIEILNEKINTLLEDIERLGCEGKVEEAQGMMKLCDQLREERGHIDDSSSSLQSIKILKANEKEMEVCDVCGAFLIVNDTPMRTDDHLKGKQHAGYAIIRAKIDEIKDNINRPKKEREELRRKEREDREVMREKERKDREAELEKKHKRTRSRSRSRSGDKKTRARSPSKDKKEPRSRSRDKRERRSRSRDRKERRSRSKDRRDRRRHSRSRSRERKRTKGHRKRSRSRSRTRRDRSRSKDRRKTRSRSRSAEKLKSSRSSRTENKTLNENGSTKKQDESNSSSVKPHTEHTTMNSVEYSEAKEDGNKEAITSQITTTTPPSSTSQPQGETITSDYKVDE